MTLDLVSARLNKGLSVRGAARKIGISRETLAAAERAESVHPGTAKKIADFYDVRVTDIWPVDEPDRTAA